AAGARSPRPAGAPDRIRRSIRRSSATRTERAATSRRPVDGARRCDAPPPRAAAPAGPPATDVAARLPAPRGRVATAPAVPAAWPGARAEPTAPQQAWREPRLGSTAPHPVAERREALPGAAAAPPAWPRVAKQAPGG